jgi:hypothetical protein
MNMKNNCVFFQQELESQKNRFEPPNGNGENWINRKGVAVDLPVTPVVEEYVPLQIKENEKIDPMQEWESLVKNSPRSEKIESVPMSELRYSEKKETLNPYIISGLVIIIIFLLYKLLTLTKRDDHIKKTELIQKPFKKKKKKIQKKKEKSKDKKNNKFKLLVEKHEKGYINDEEFKTEARKLFK